MKRAQDRTVLVVTRMPRDLVEKLLATRLELAGRSPGLKVSRADTVRILLYGAIEARVWERKNKPEK